MIFEISTSKHQELVDITDKVNEIVSDCGVNDGICHVYAFHATAGIVIIESYDPDICLDFLDALNNAVPEKAGYRHDRVDGNAGAHIKAAMLSPGITVPVKNGKLLLGTWQAINVVELDGPRNLRRIKVSVVSENK
ncbi:YjbQ family protein [Candidatus Woesearchaeota archaeon]|nr:YjbQ family protein [Candidatus Woesearchaeota archaeon]